VASAKKDPPPTPAPTPGPVLTPSPLPPLQPTPGVPVATGEVALRCSTCHKLSRWSQAFIDAHKGKTVTCPICETVSSV
jgi:hypothetical protein